ncbi:uncharacterized protein H6S33_007248 [Morchella sextelata]|uniref:uncharacterized protein n=1 Tax=Morchella sextelata TaxID=1174677 RepID=UPI001D05B99A|nr:uncharacterized protein H6S33_007248 [Morchella sextelata]KAH0604217.1 hypothetical protein H6S33_007248 [Morchella sextelata]
MESESPFSRKAIEEDLHCPIPKKSLAIVTCMDAWIHPRDAFDVELGDAHVIRNAGGSAREALRSIIISQQFLDTKVIMVVKHTECGMMGLTNENAHAKIKNNLGVSADHIDFMGFEELEQSVRDDVAWLKEQDLIHPESKEKIKGYIFHVNSDPALRKLVPVV